MTTQSSDLFTWINFRERHSPKFTLLLCVGLLLSACATREHTYQTPGWAETIAPSGTVDHRLVLVGDAGGPIEDAAALLAGMSRFVRASEAPTTVVFLGDNIYQVGLPNADDEGFAEAVQRLTAQAAAFRDSGARVVFVPGNHDWDSGGREGWTRMRAQTAFLHGLDVGVEIVIAPENGCPGPNEFRLGSRAVLVTIDTQWWLHEHEKPRPGDNPDGCRYDEPEEVAGSLSRMIGEASGWTVVAAHHPLRTNGRHSGYFDPSVHLFGLRSLGMYDGSVLGWLPIPIIGTAISMTRSYRSPSRQDLSHPAYQKMKRSIEEAIAAGESSRVLFAAGHDHNIQLLGPDEDVALHIVSGLGLANHETTVDHDADTLFSHASPELPGFVVVDFYRPAGVLTSVYGVDASEQIVPMFSWRTKPLAKSGG